MNLKRLPIITAIGAPIAAAIMGIAALLNGWQAKGKEHYLFYFFSIFLVLLAVSSIISGNTLFHHYLTKTVQRSSSPKLFWTIIFIQIMISVALGIIGFWQGVNKSSA